MYIWRDLLFQYPCHYSFCCVGCIVVMQFSTQYLNNVTSKDRVIETKDFKNGLFSMSFWITGICVGLMTGFDMLSYITSKLCNVSHVLCNVSVKWQMWTDLWQFILEPVKPFIPVTPLICVLNRSTIVVCGLASFLYQDWACASLFSGLSMERPFVVTSESIQHFLCMP